MDLEKKRREQIYFDLFRDVYGEIPQGVACVQERPDFVINSAWGRIGVEVTRYFRPTPPDRRPLQEQFSLQHQMARRAQLEYEKVTAQKLSVKIVFHPGVNINKSDVLPSSDELARALIGVDLTETLTRIEFTKDRWPTSVLSMHARKCLGREQSLWRPATAAWVRRLVPQDVKQEIVRKAASLSGYDSDLLEVWLLIVADGLAFVELSDETTNHSYQAEFDRVIFLDVFGRKCTNFKVQRINPGAVSSPDVA